MKGRRDLPFAPGDHGVFSPGYYSHANPHPLRLRLVRHRPGPFFFEPTIFFRSTNGGLEEALDVFIRSGGTAADGAKITVNGKSFSLNA